MREATTARSTPQLAAAFLALCDDGAMPEPNRRSALATLLMVAAIALATPLAWLSAPVGKPSSVPLATPATKAAPAAPGDDGPAS